MKFVISTQELNYLINKCLNAVPVKPTIPILSNILVEAANDEIVLTATDLTVGVRCFTDAKVLEEGATTLPAKRLAQLTRELTSVNVEIATDKQEITEITADASRFKLHGMKRDTFPSLPDLEGAQKFQMKASELKELLACTSFAVSKEDNRYALTGVFMHIENGKAQFVGTDGKRLAKSQTTLECDPSLQGSYIIPIKAVDEIYKNLEGEGDATLYLTSDKIGVEASNARVITKLLSGEYPDVNRVIPSNSEKIVSLHREELISLLRQVALFTNDANQSVRFSFNPGELQISANTMDVGEGKVSMPVNYQGEKLDIAFNPNYFLDILRHSKEEAVTMGLTDSYSPGVITDKDGITTISMEETPLFVLMPLRLNEQ